MSAVRVLTALVCLTSVAAANHKDKGVEVIEIQSNLPRGWLEGAGGFRRAMNLQAATGLPVLLYFHTDWCRYCKELERRLLPDPSVERALQKILRVRINPEVGTEELALASQYRATGYPTLLITTRARQKRLNVFPRSGLISPARFVAQLKASAR